MRLRLTRQVIIIPDDGVIRGGDAAEGTLGAFERPLVLGGHPVEGLVVVLHRAAGSDLLALHAWHAQLAQGCKLNLLHHAPLRSDVHAAAVCDLLHNITVSVIA